MSCQVLSEDVLSEDVLSEDALGEDAFSREAVSSGLLGEVSPSAAAIEFSLTPRRFFVRDAIATVLARRKNLTRSQGLSTCPGHTRDLRETAMPSACRCGIKK